MGRAELRGVSAVFDAISPLHRSLDYHLERHNVLATNLAHVDTPGFRPSDLARTDVESFPHLLQVALERTSTGHMGNDFGAGGPRHGKLFEDLSAGAGADGNYVSLDREAAKVAANQLRYDVVTALVSAELRQLMYAANDGK